jgi:hypothetical protein
MDKAIELGSCLYTVIGASVVAWGIWRAWVRPKDQKTVNLAERKQPIGWNWRDELTRLFLVTDNPPDNMSSDPDEDDTQERGATGLANNSDDGLQPIAMPRKAANDALALGGLGDVAANDLSDITPAEARAIIRQQARAEAIVAILRAAESGKVKSAGDQASLIEAVAGGARTSRPGTPYTLLKIAVDELRGKARPEYVGDMIARVQREVTAEQR